MLTISIPDHALSFLVYFYLFHVYLTKKTILVSYSDQQRFSLAQLRKTAQDNVTVMKYPRHLKGYLPPKVFPFLSTIPIFPGPSLPHHLNFHPLRYKDENKVILCTILPVVFVLRNSYCSHNKAVIYMY